MLGMFPNLFMNPIHITMLCLLLFHNFVVFRFKNKVEETFKNGILLRLMIMLMFVNILLFVLNIADMVYIAEYRILTVNNVMELINLGNIY